MRAASRLDRTAVAKVAALLAGATNGAARDTAEAADEAVCAGHGLAQVTAVAEAAAGAAGASALIAAAAGAAAAATARASPPVTIVNFLARLCANPVAAGNITLRNYNLNPLGAVAGWVAVQDLIDQVLASLVGPLGLAIPAGHPLIARLQAAGCPPLTMQAAQDAAAAHAGVCDVIEVPVVFGPNEDDGRNVDGVTVDMINMVVMNDVCAVPFAYGPWDPHNNRDVFFHDLEGQLTGLGLTVRGIRTWLYHISMGGAHCGSNTLREIAPFRWWEYPNVP